MPAEETEDSSGQAADSDIVDGEELVPSEAEKAAELYKGNVVKYLLIPAGVEVPVGLEDDMILVQMPEKDEDADGTSDTKKDYTKNKESASEKKSDEEEWITERKAYVADETLLETMKELGLLDMVAAVGMEKEECQVPEIVQKMEAEQGEKTAEIVYGGLFDMPDFKTLDQAGSQSGSYAGRASSQGGRNRYRECRQDKDRSKGCDRNKNRARQPQTKRRKPMSFFLWKHRQSFMRI